MADRPMQVAATLARTDCSAPSHRPHPEAPLPQAMGLERMRARASTDRSAGKHAREGATLPTTLQKTAPKPLKACLPPARLSAPSSEQRLRRRASTASLVDERLFDDVSAGLAVVAFLEAAGVEDGAEVGEQRRAATQHEAVVSGVDR